MSDFYSCFALLSMKRRGSSWIWSWNESSCQYHRQRLAQLVEFSWRIEYGMINISLLF